MKWPLAGLNNQYHQTSVCSIIGDVCYDRQKFVLLCVCPECVRYSCILHHVDL